MAVEPRPRRLRSARRRRARAAARRRVLPGQPHPPSHARPSRRPGRALRRDRTLAPRAARGAAPPPRSGSGHRDRVGVPRVLPAPLGARDRDPPDQGNGCHTRGARDERQGPRRERDDRRPRPQRPRTPVRAGHHRGAGALRGRGAPRAAPPGQHGDRSPAGRRRHGRRRPRHLPTRLGHRCAEAARPPGHRGPRAGPTRRLLRSGRLDRHVHGRSRDRRVGARGGDPDLHRARARRDGVHAARCGRRDRRRFPTQRRVGRDRAEGEPLAAARGRRRGRAGHVVSAPTSVWIDGKLVDAADARVSPFDHGLLVGDGVFETIRVYGGEPFAWTRHLERLAHSASGLGLAVPDRPQLRAAAHTGLAADGHQEARLRVTVTGGVAPLGSERGEAAPTVIVASSPVRPWPDAVRVVVVPWVRNDRGATAGLKTTSYAENVRALAYAHERGASEAIFANTRDELCEATGSNVFVVRDGVLTTPPASSGCLLGVTRALVLELGVPVDETALPLAALRSADEAFLTSTTREVQPIAAVDDRALPAVPGPVTARLATAFAELLARDLDP